MNLNNFRQAYPNNSIKKNQIKNGEKKKKEKKLKISIKGMWYFTIRAI